jgi:hypothetical protein
MENAFEGIMAILRDIAVTVDAPKLIELACGIPVKRREIEVLDAKVTHSIDSNNNNNYYYYRYY